MMIDNYFDGHLIIITVTFIVCFMKFLNLDLNFLGTLLNLKDLDSN